MPLDRLAKGNLVYVKFRYQELISGLYGMYRLAWKTEPAHVMEVSDGLVKVKFVREPWQMIVEDKDVTTESTELGDSDDATDSSGPSRRRRRTMGN